MIFCLIRVQPVIDKNIADMLGYKYNQSNSLRTIGGNISAQTIMLPNVECLSKQLSNFTVNVVDLNANISFFCNGLLGMDFLTNLENFKIDLTNKVIETN